jgi:hypothetical protein
MPAVPRSQSHARTYPLKNLSIAAIAHGAIPRDQRPRVWAILSPFHSKRSLHFHYKGSLCLPARTYSEPDVSTLEQRLANTGRLAIVVRRPARINDMSLPKSRFVSHQRPQ